MFSYWVTSQIDFLTEFMNVMLGNPSVPAPCKYPYPPFRLPLASSLELPFFQCTDLHKTPIVVSNGNPTCSTPYPAVMQSLWDNVQSHQFTLDKSHRKMKALLSRLTLNCYITLFILQGSRFVDGVVLQITNDNIVCTHYAVPLNDCCQQKQSWFDASLSLSSSVYFCLCVQIADRSQPFPQIVTAHTNKNTLIHNVFVSRSFVV